MPMHCHIYYCMRGWREVRFIIISNNPKNRINILKPNRTLQESTENIKGGWGTDVSSLHSEMRGDISIIKPS